MTKAKVIKNWKPELKSLGFAHEKGAFYLQRTIPEYLQLSISIQRNLHADTYKINSSIILRSPFVDIAEPELFLLANLRKNGIYLHVTSKSWWPVDELTEALGMLRKYVTPWFEEWGRPEYLAEMLETAIREEKAVIDVAEPLPEEGTRAPWQRAERTKRKIPPMYFYHAAILHYLNHDLGKSIARTQDWIKSLHSDEKVLQAKAQIQLAKLEASAPPAS